MTEHISFMFGKFATAPLKRTSQVEEIIVLKTVDGLKLATNVELLCSAEEVLNTGVGIIIAAEDLDSLLDPVRRLATGSRKRCFFTVERTCQACRHPRQSEWRGGGHRESRGG